MSQPEDLWRNLTPMRYTFLFDVVGGRLRQPETSFLPTGNETPGDASRRVIDI